MNKEKLIHQLFLGKICDELGYDKTLSILRECNEAFGVKTEHKTFYRAVSTKADEKCTNQCEGCIHSVEKTFK